MKNNSDAFGFLLIDKKEGISSAHVDGKAKRFFSTSRVGHLGTLDPFASGLLLLAVGETTKLLNLVEDGKKEYLATLLLGSETDTLDRTGNIIATKNVPPLTKEQIEEVFSSFLGDQKQIPPSYSAKWIDGRRAYDLAREGQEVHLQPIDVRIDSLELLDYSSEEKTISFRTTVSKGTYIRSLGRDIAKRLGTLGHLLSLRRTRIGNFDVDKAKDIDSITKADFLNPEEVVKNLRLLEVDAETAKKAVQGRPLSFPLENDYLLLVHEGKRLAVYRKEDKNHYLCYRGFRHD